MCISRPTTNAIMGLTVANYVLQPFFSAECGVPPLAAQLIAAILICNQSHIFVNRKLKHSYNMF